VGKHPQGVLPRGNIYFFLNLKFLNQKIPK
jgi:hypothetical protein